MLTHSEIFKKTLPFVWAKLVLGLITVGISVGLLLVTVGLIWLFRGLAWPIFMALWMVATVFVHFAIMRYTGYLVRVGHIAVVAEAVTTGKIPDNQLEYGKQMVRERFLTANVFFVLDRLVDNAIKQLQNVFERAGGMLGSLPGLRSIPGLKLVMSFGKLFIGISLKYIDECCLGYIFYKKDQGVFKSATDGVVIYAQNWKKLLKTALSTSVMVVLLTIGLTILLFTIIGSIVQLIFVSAGVASGASLMTFFFGLFLSIFLAFTFKRAFIDSYIMVRMMTAYMEEAPSTVITFDLYGKFSSMSKSFKQLFEKAEAEGPISAPSQIAQPAFAGTPGATTGLSCSCGTQSANGSAFCGNCGVKLA